MDTEDRYFGMTLSLSCEPGSQEMFQQLCETGFFLWRVICGPKRNEPAAVWCRPALPIVLPASHLAGDHQQHVTLLSRDLVHQPSQFRNEAVIGGGILAGVCFEILRRNQMRDGGRVSTGIENLIQGYVQSRRESLKSFK